MRLVRHIAPLLEFRLPREMIAKLKKVAKRKGGVGYQTLLKIWIAERLEKEIA